MINNIIYKIIIKINDIYKRFCRKMLNKKYYLRFKHSKGQIGKGVKFGNNVNISGIDNIKIGDNVHIGTGCFFRGEGGLKIGDNVIISRNVIIYTSSHNYEGKLLPFDSSYLFKTVEIGRNSWVGMNVTISPGTTIGEGVIIGLGSNVHGKIPELAIIGSEKPKIIKYRNKEHYYKLEKKKRYAKENGLSLNKEDDEK